MLTGTAEGEWWDAMSISFLSKFHQLLLASFGISWIVKGWFFFFFSNIFKDLIYLFLERGQGREKERERNINVWLPLTLAWPHTGDLACNSVMCPDWESSRWPFGPQDSTHSTELHQPGHDFSNLSFLWPLLVSILLQGKTLSSLNLIIHLFTHYRLMYSYFIQWVIIHYYHYLW